jgi:ABC-type multidrug transport system ATPase subunit
MFHLQSIQVDRSSSRGVLGCGTGASCLAEPNLTMTCAIQTDALSKRFGRVNALDRLDFCVPQGAVHALVGPNGAGKTTLIKILMNIFRASSGRASVLGLDSTKISGRAFESIGYVSENQQLPGWMLVGKFLSYLRPFYPTWDAQLETRLVQQFDLPLDRKLKHLSRGMRMKAALAGSLAYRPSLIVLDEPFSGLDPMVRDELGKALVERSADSTIFLSSHDLAEVEGFATHLAFLDSGRLRLSEDMPSLRARFREVELTLAAPVALPSDLPATWLEISASDSVIRFVDSAFNQETTPAEIARGFGPVRNATFAPMTLRAIFLAIAKGNRNST